MCMNGRLFCDACGEELALKRNTVKNHLCSGTKNTSAKVKQKKVNTFVIKFVYSQDVLDTILECSSTISNVRHMSGF